MIFYRFSFPNIWVHHAVFTVYSNIVAIILPPTLNVFIYFLLFCLLVKKKNISQSVAQKVIELQRQELIPAGQPDRKKLGRHISRGIHQQELIENLRDWGGHVLTSRPAGD